MKNKVRKIAETKSTQTSQLNKNQQNPVFRAFREAHYSKFFGREVGADMIYPSKDGLTISINVYVFKPTEDRKYWTLITGGMSDHCQKIPQGFRGTYFPRTELKMYVDEPREWMIKILMKIAERPFIRKTWIHQYKIIANIVPSYAHYGFPPLTSGLILQNYESNGFDTLTLSGEKVEFFTVTLITDAERQFALKNGVWKLVENLDSSVVSYADEYDRTK